MQRETLPTSRIKIILLGFYLIYLLVVFRLIKLQLIDHKKYTSDAENQYGNLQIINPKRGNIYSSEGFVLAGTSTHYLLYAEPKKVVNRYDTARRVAEVLSSGGVEYEKYEDYYRDKINNSLNLDLLWVVLERNISPVKKEEIEGLEIKGLGFEEEPARYYPEGSLAAHVLGYVAQNESGEKTGYYGVEGMLNEDLKGKPGRVIQDVDAMGIPILSGKYKKVDPIQGRDVYLTIDRSIQYIVEKKIKEGVEKYNALSGSVIVMNPFTGDVLAMANFPTYSPGNFLEEETHLPDSDRKNIERVNFSVSRTFEPGSVIKPVTIAAGIDLHLINPNTTFYDNGPVQYSDYTIDNWDGKHHGAQTVIQLLQKSNNIGAAWVGHQVGSKNLHDYMDAFGLGRITEIELEGENTGILHDYKDWTDIDLATISFGQGISATSLQVLNAFNVIANGGYLLQPRIIKEIHEVDDVIEIPTKNLGRVINTETSATMIKLLEEAASGGEAKYFILKNYRIAGKTGTAQIPDEKGGYYEDKTNATFVGFVARSKKFSMIVNLQEPKASIYASETAVPLWMEITQELVKSFGLPPDRADLENLE
ncbi:penicillin-binding protein 2 [Patescibacteria group bacterium]|nr:penicillin-binding protein 2 [Patescibacteria group bacterium]